MKIAPGEEGAFLVKTVAFFSGTGPSRCGEESRGKRVNVIRVDKETMVRVQSDQQTLYKSLLTEIMKSEDQSTTALVGEGSSNKQTQRIFTLQP